MTTRVAQVGLGQWGKNLARNFDQLAELVRLCDVDDERRVEGAQSYPSAQVTSSFDDVLTDESVEAVVVATPVPTHYELARRALEAGKHVFVEKPPAMRGAEMEELCELAEDRDRVLMPGHLLLYHPGVQKLKEIVDSGELGDVLYVYGNRQNLGTFRTNENALWSLGVHDLSVLLYLIEEEPSEVRAHGNAFLSRGVEESSATRGWRCSTTWSGTGRSRSTTTGELARATSTARQSTRQSRCGASVSTSCGWSPVTASRTRSRVTRFLSFASSISYRLRSKQSRLE